MFDDVVPEEVSAIFVAFKEFIKEAIARFEREGQALFVGYDWQRLYFRSDPEHMVLAIAFHVAQAGVFDGRRRLEYDQPQFHFDVQNMDDNGVAVRGMTGKTIDLDHEPPYIDRLTPERVAGLISFDPEYRAQTPELIRRMTRTVSRGSSVSNDDFHLPYRKWLEQFLGRARQ